MFKVNAERSSTHRMSTRRLFNATSFSVSFLAAILMVIGFNRRSLEDVQMGYSSFESGRWRCAFPLIKCAFDGPLRLRMHCASDLVGERRPVNTEQCIMRNWFAHAVRLIVGSQCAPLEHTEHGVALFGRYLCATCLKHVNTRMHVTY